MPIYVYYGFQKEKKRDRNVFKEMAENVPNLKKETDIQVQKALSVCAQSLSCVQLFLTPLTEVCQAPLSMELSR